MTTTDETVVRRLVEAMATGDRPALDEILDERVRLRALLPSRYVELVGGLEVAGEMFGWFEDVPEIAVVDTRVEPVGDVWHAGFRFALRGLVPERVVVQHLFCTVHDGSIRSIRLTCSGFRPAAVAVETPAVSRQLDALGEGCATLTPKIAATLRGMSTGEVLAVLTDDPSAPDDVAAWSRLTGHPIVATAAEAGGIRYYLRHG